MLVIPFNHGSHTESIATLLLKNGMDPSLTYDLPQHGLIAMKGDVIVAAGFLRCIEGQYAMLDSYITNPEASSAIRDKALDMITAKLLKLTKRFSVKKVLAFSVHQTIVDRAKRHGLQELPANILIKA